MKYIYRARCVNVVDGDTADLHIDQGMRNYSVQRLRLVGIDTPEMHDKDPAVREKAQTAKAALAAMILIPGEWPLIIETFKEDSFGRYLADIWVENGNRWVNKEMLAAGYAVVRLK